MEKERERWGESREKERGVGTRRERGLEEEKEGGEE